MRWCVLWSVTKNLRKGWGQIVPTLYVQMQVATGEIVGGKCFLRIIRELCMGAKNNMKKSVKMFVYLGDFFYFCGRFLQLSRQQWS